MIAPIGGSDEEKAEKAMSSEMPVRRRYLIN